MSQRCLRMSTPSIALRLGLRRPSQTETFPFFSKHGPLAKMRPLSRGQIFAQRICSLGIGRATANVAPPEVEVERVRAGFETRCRVAGTLDRGFGPRQKDGADPAAGVRRRDIQRRDTLTVYLDPADCGPVHHDPHVMVSDRPSDPI